MFIDPAKSLNNRGGIFAQEIAKAGFKFVHHHPIYHDALNVVNSKLTNHSAPNKKTIV